MPYKIFPQDDKFAVYKVDASRQRAGQALGSHDSEGEAKEQLKALYAQENKELTTKMWGGEIAYPMYGPVSFSELEALEAVEEVTMNVQKLAYCFPQVAMSIMHREDITDKEAALTTLAGEFAERVEGVMAGTETKEADCPDCEDDRGMSLKAVWSTAFVNNLPDSSFLFVEPKCGEKDNEGKTKPRSCRHFPYKDASGKIDLPRLRNAIARIPQAKITGLDKTGLQARARRLLENTQKEQQSESWLNRLKEVVVDGVKSALGIQRSQEANQFFVWKEAETGQYWWLARYSNNIRDDDNPPEIISAKSHRRFVELVDKGLAPLPELWLWHIPDWKWGQAKSVAYDDDGFAIAMGTVDKGCEPVAEWAMAQKDLLTSHGMPRPIIRRDPEDPTIIIEHETREISPLFDWAAANKRTGFYIFDLSATKEDDMAIPAHKRDELLKAGLAQEVLDALEAKNAAEAKEVKDAGLQTKDAQQPATEQPAATQPAATPEPAPATDAPEQPLTADAIAGAIVAAFKPINERLEALEGQVKELSRSEEEKIKERAAAIPPASLEALVTQSLFSKENQVSGNSKLVKSGPKETPANTSEGQPFFMGWIKGTPATQQQ